MPAQPPGSACKSQSFASQATSRRGGWWGALSTPPLGHGSLEGWAGYGPERWVLSAPPDPSRGLWAALLVQIRAGTPDTLLHPMSFSFPICERGFMSGLPSWEGVELAHQAHRRCSLDY